MKFGKCFVKSVAILPFLLLITEGPLSAHATGGRLSGKTRNSFSGFTLARTGSSGQMAAGFFGSGPFPRGMAAAAPAILGSLPPAVPQNAFQPQSGFHNRRPRHHGRQTSDVFVYNFVTPAYFPYCDYYDCYAPPYPYEPAPPIYPPPPVYPPEDAGPPYWGGYTEEAPPADPGESAAYSDGFDQQGEQAFKAGDYPAALRAWQHAALDDPNNGTLLMKMSLALFAAGHYQEAAGATQRGLLMLPQPEWGDVVSRYQEFYSRRQDYADQLKNLEKAVAAKPKEPALHFLLGFHYGYSGRIADAKRELDKLAALAPKDEVGHRLRDMITEKIKNHNESRFAEAQGGIYVRKDSRGVLYFTNVPNRSDYRPTDAVSPNAPLTNEY